MIIAWIKSRFKWEYIGTCTAKSLLRYNDREDGYWVYEYFTLYQRPSGRRKVVKTGDGGNSPMANEVRHQVKIWLSGGPLPTASEPEYLQAEPKKTAELIVLNGGRDGAA